jgi:hypothetical protein
LVDTPGPAGYVTHMRVPGAIEGVPLGWEDPPPFGR